MPQQPNTHLAPGGVTARYIGVAGGATVRYYWVQAVYVAGVSPLASVQITTPSSLTLENRVGIQWNPSPNAIAYNVYFTTSATPPSSGAIALSMGDSATGFSDIGTSNAPMTAMVLSRGIKEAFLRYEFGVDGGVVSTVSASTADVLPAGAVVFLGNWFIPIAPVGSGASVAIGVLGGTTNSILAATAITSLTLNATGICACQTTPFRVAAAGQLTVTISGAALTAGSVEAHVFYYLPTRL